MSVALGAHTFGCGNFHDPAPVALAPKRTERFDVFGLNGVGEIDGGYINREIPIRATYLNRASKLALYADLATDDGQKGSTQATLTVDGVTFPNVAFRGLAVQGARIFRNGVDGTWVAADVILVFEQMAP